MTKEEERLSAVREALLLDFNRSEFQDIVELASQLCKKPIALISILDNNFNWIKVTTAGITHVGPTPRETSFTQYSIKQNDVLIIPDASKDERFDSNPFVQEDPFLKFYAGAPLTLKNGIRLGTLSLFDSEPGELTELQKRTLVILSRQATNLIELALNHELLKKQIDETEAKNESLRKIAYIQSHHLRHPLTSIMGLVNLVKEDAHKVDDTWLEMMKESANQLDSRIQVMANESMSHKDVKILRFNRMVEEIEDYAILMLDRNGNIENWNKGAEVIKGYKSSEIIGKNFSLFYSDEDRKNGRPLMLINKATDEGKAKDEGWRYRKDGTRFWGSILITAIHDDNKKVIGFTKVTKDLTKEMSAQTFIDSH